MFVFFTISAKNKIILGLSLVSKSNLTFCGNLTNRSLLHIYEYIAWHRDRGVMEMRKVSLCTALSGHNALNIFMAFAVGQKKQKPLVHHHHG